MKSVVNLAILTFSFMISLCAVQNTMAADPAELESLRDSFLTRKDKLVNDYIEELSSQERSMIGSSNAAGTQAVRQEKDRMIRELPQVSAAPPPAPLPPPEPEVKKRDPKTHVSSVGGIAGAPSFSRNNIYTFNLADIGATTTMSYWATGRRSIDSTGNVWLTTPDGRREKVSRWKDRYFKEPATEVSSYEKLQPITEDISGMVTSPGIYRVEFEWTGGIDPLVIFRVELTS